VQSSFVSNWSTVEGSIAVREKKGWIILTQVRTIGCPLVSLLNPGHSPGLIVLPKQVPVKANSSPTEASTVRSQFRCEFIVASFQVGIAKHTTIVSQISQEGSQTISLALKQKVSFGVFVQEKITNSDNRKDHKQ
jgi:hypothetical protein